VKTAINNARSTVQIALSVSVYRADCHALVDLVYHSPCSMYDYAKQNEHNLLVCIGKSEAELTNNRKLRSRYCTVEANY